VRCVQALLQQTIADQLEVIVVDNHSLDDSIGVIRNRLSASPCVRVIEAPNNLGFGGGYNYGARFAQGEYLLINNPAKTLPLEGVERLVRKMESDDSIGILAPELKHPDGSIRLSPREFPGPMDVIAKRSPLKWFFQKRLKRYLQLEQQSHEERAVDWVAGGCFVIPRALFGQLGGFDERFFLFFEDTDLCRRCQRAGKKIVYYPSVSGDDRLTRLSGGGMLSMLFTRIGWIHLMSALRYFRKWGVLR
jgi:GT2 family glycosyltransferase